MRKVKGISWTKLCIGLKSNQSLVGQEDEKLQKWIYSEGRIRIDRMLHLKGVKYIQTGCRGLEWGESGNINCRRDTLLLKEGNVLKMY